MFRKDFPAKSIENYSYPHKKKQTLLRKKPKAGTVTRRERVSKNRTGVVRVWRRLEGLSASRAKRRQLYEFFEVAATCADTAA